MKDHTSACRPTEAQVRGRARRRGFQVMQTRGREALRRQARGLGELMLLDDNSVVLFECTLEEIAAFLMKHDKKQRQNFH
jgi:hypothetical protein